MANGHPSMWLLLQALNISLHKPTSSAKDWSAKAGCLQLSLEKFSTLSGLKMCQLLFIAVEQLSLILQKNDIDIQDALSAVEVAKSYFKWIYMIRGRVWSLL